MAAHVAHVRPLVLGEPRRGDGGRLEQEAKDARWGSQLQPASWHEVVHIDEWDAAALRRVSALHTPARGAAEGGSAVAGSDGGEEDSGEEESGEEESRDEESENEESGDEKSEEQRGAKSDRNLDEVALQALLPHHVQSLSMLEQLAAVADKQ